MKSSYPLSVIVPLYNASDTFEASLNSLLNQSIGCIEIIVINDASTDDTKSRLETFSKPYSNIIIINLPKNLGVHKARSIAIERATASWIGFLDADDFAKPNMFKKMFDTAIHHKVDLVVCESDRVTPQRKFLFPKVRFVNDSLVVDDIFERFCKLDFGTAAHWNKLYKAELIKKWGTIDYESRQNTNEDLLVNIGVFHEAKSIYLVKEVLHEYTYNPKSVTSITDRNDAFFSTIKSYFLVMNIYAFFDEKAFNLITELYRKKLEAVDCTPEKAQFSESQLQVILPLLEGAVSKYPLGLLTLLCRRPKKEFKILGFKFPVFIKKIMLKILK